jgi:hypothetical protein
VVADTIEAFAPGGTDIEIIIATADASAVGTITDTAHISAPEFETNTTNNTLTAQTT